jgi:hypothetical protein
LDAPGERDSKEWLLGPRGAELEAWEDAAANLPGVATNGLAALLCVPQSAPTVWVRDDVVDDLAVWDVLQSLVRQHDAGERDPEVWTPVLDGQAHLAVIQDASA